MITLQQHPDLPGDFVPQIFASFDEAKAHAELTTPFVDWEDRCIGYTDAYTAGWTSSVQLLPQWVITEEAA